VDGAPHRVHDVAMSSSRRHRPPIPSRRRFLQQLSLAGVPIVAGASVGSFLAGCVGGEHQLASTFLIRADAMGAFGGWTDFRLSDVPDDVSATLKRASLSAPAGENDLTFFQHLSGDGYDWATTERVPLVRVESFPKDDTIGVFEVVYFEDLRRFISTTLEKPTIRIVWNGVIDLTKVTVPKEGLLIDFMVTIDVT
jgi:hypothetical protein